MSKTKALAKPTAKPSPVVERVPEAAAKAPHRATASRELARQTLPPPNGEPAPRRAANLLRFPGGPPGMQARARMSSGMQKVVGNARIGRMMEEPAKTGEPGTAGTEAGIGPAGAPATGGAAGGTAGGAAGGAAPSDAAAGGAARPAAPATTLLERARVAAGRLLRRIGGGGGPLDAMRGLLGRRTRPGAGQRPKHGAARGAGKRAAKGKKRAKGDASTAAETPAGETPTAVGPTPAATGGGPPPLPPPLPGAAAADAGSSSQIFENFTRAPASAIAAGLPALGQQVTAGYDRDRESAEQNAPDLAVTADGGPDARLPAPPVIPPVPRPSQSSEPPPPAAPGARPRIGSQSGKIRTDAGPSPRFQPQGEANPNRTTQEQQKVAGQAGARHAEIARQIQTNPGATRVQPQPFGEQRALSVPKNKASAPRAEATKEMEEFLQAPYEGGLRDQIDQAMAPRLEKSLAGPRDTVARAAAKRDADYDAKLKESQDEAAQLGEQANQEQAETVQKARADVAGEKQKGLAEGQQKLDGFNADLSQRRRAKVDEINRRIESDEKKADQELAKGERDAEARKRKADQEAEEKEREAKRKKKNLPWYKKIAKFFSKIFDALKKAVTKLMDLAKKAVKGIISAAQKLAKGIIDAATKFVTSAIKVFGEVAKGLVTTLVGSVFPELADKINSAIDQTVSVATEIVNKIGEKLKEGVDYIADKLNQAVDFIHNFFSAMVEGGFAMLQALLTGDFLEMAKIAFRTACKMAGLPGDELLKILEKAASQFLWVIKNPATFVKNLIKSVMKGFNQFMANFGQHIVTALMGWLFGQVAATGIKLPTKFDLAGIFDLVRQVMGLTYEYVRERAVSILGEEKVAMIEKVAGWVKRLFTEGPIALWREFKQYLGNLKDQIMSQARDWLITKVVQAAILKITTMLIPGAGFIQAILSIYETVKFFIERIKDILEVVNSVLDSIQQIAKGAIGAAANFIEQTMVKTMPLVMDFLARLLKIGNIGAKIREIINTLRKPVNKAVDFVVKGAAKLFKTGAGKLKAGASRLKEGIVGWWKQRKRFRMGGESHSLFFKGEGRNAQLTMASVEVPLERYAPTLEAKAKKFSGIPGLQGHVNDIFEQMRSIKKAKETDDWKKEYKPGLSLKDMNARDKRHKEVAGEISRRLKIIAAKLALISNLTEDKQGHEDLKLPESKVKFKTPDNMQRAQGLTVETLSLRPGKTVGSEPTIFRGNLWTRLGHYDNQGKARHLVRGHLLNHHVHGPGDTWENLAIIPRKMNDDMANPFERKIKDEVFRNKGVGKYTARVAYGGHTGWEGTAPYFMPTHIKLDFQPLKLRQSPGDVPGNWVPDPDPKKTAPPYDKPITIPTEIKKPQRQLPPVQSAGQAQSATDDQAQTPASSSQREKRKRSAEPPVEGEQLPTLKSQRPTKEEGND